MKNTTTKSRARPNKAYLDALLSGTAASTQRAYKRDLRYFWTWAKYTHRIKEAYPVKVNIVIKFVLDNMGGMSKTVENKLIAGGLRKKPGALRVRTIRRYLSSLSVAHSEHGVESPVIQSQVKLLLRRLQNANAGLQSNKKGALTADLIKKMAAKCPNTLTGKRDKAILLVGFASGGRRRSELANMEYTDVKKVKDGYILHLRHSKTDQAGNGRDVPVFGAAAKALSTWLVASGIRSGKLFRGIKRNGLFYDSICGRTINRIVKHYASEIGLDTDSIGAHSLRSGFVTETGRRGANLNDAMALSGHRSFEVASGYYREGELLRNPTSKLLE